MHKLLSTTQVAKLCKLSQPMIHQEILAGRLVPSFKSEGKQRTRYLFTREDVLAYQAWRTKTYNEQFDPLPDEEERE
ncbi:helix-turn-helix domain-containing protein [Herpetosiphon gulosus]|uniref:Helix-turn-helix domain-containing protein n=1 Tax=Herpetosiphon gulosus TaxID=1973496 RepID=A0ABP9X8W6_9CHLR